MLGLDNAGKTTILKSLSNEVTLKTSRTSPPSHLHKDSTSRISLMTGSNSTCGILEDRRRSESTGGTTLLILMH